MNKLYERYLSWRIERINSRKDKLEEENKKFSAEIRERDSVPNPSAFNLYNTRVCNVLINDNIGEILRLHFKLSKLEFKLDYAN